MADIYDIDFSIQAENLIPPHKRKSRIIAFLTSLLSPIQWLGERRLQDYRKGTNHLDWLVGVSYSAGVVTTFSDKSDYECLLPHVSATSNQPSGGVDSATYWRKLNDNFIGTLQRSRFNSQIIVLEYNLNKWYRIPTTDPQIYVSTNINPNQFIMAQAGKYSSKMPNNSVFMGEYLWENPNFSGNDFTVFVPAAFFLTLGDTTQNRTNNVRRFVDKLRIAGITYNVTTY